VNNLTLHIQCVYGEEDVEHIQKLLLPSLETATRHHVVLHVLNYNGSTEIQPDSNFPRVKIHQVQSLGRVAGFGENQNRIFESYEAPKFFFLLNPDCVVDEFSADVLVETYENESNVGIVEARQWPFELTKSFDAITLETSWAAAAFILVDSETYRQVGGLDTAYFLYCEDVDLSWSMWLLGKRVLYQPEASVFHFTGSRHYQKNFTSLEWFFGVRNYLYLARKFFGPKAQSKAKREVLRRVESSLARWAVTSYSVHQAGINTKPPFLGAGKDSTKVRMTGLADYGGRSE
jgi:GT2 family glycosyltransferase